MRLPGLRSRGRRTLNVAVAVILVAACSPDSGPEVVDVRTSRDDIPEADVSTEPVTIRATPKGVWGLGRAELARSTGDVGPVAIASTAGIHLLADDGQIRTLATLTGPPQPSALEFSPDGAHVAVALTSSPDSAPRVDLYRIGDGTLVASWLLDPGDNVRDVAFTETGTLLVHTAAAIAELPMDPSHAPTRISEGVALGDTALLPDGSIVGPVQNTNELLVRRPGEQATVEAVDALPDGLFMDAQTTPSGDLVAVSMRSSTEFDQLDGFALIDLSTLAVRVVIPASAPLTSQQWAVGESFLVVADGTGAVATRMDDLTERSLMSSADAPVSKLLVSSANVVAIHSDGTVTVWDVTGSTGAPVAVVPGGVAFHDVSLDAAGSALTAVDFYGRIVRLQIPSGAVLLDENRLTSGELTAVAIDPAGTSIAAASNTGQVVVLDGDLTTSWTIDQQRGRVDSVAFVPTSGLLATGIAERLGETAFDDTVTVWDPTARSELFTIAGDGADVPGCFFYYNRVRFSPDGRLMATASHDFTVVIADTASGAVVEVLEPHLSTVLDVAFSPDGELIVTTSDDSTVRVWRTADFSLAAEYPATMGGYTAIAVAPDGNTMVVTDVAGAVAMVDIMTGAPILQFEDAAHRTTVLALSADGSLLAAPRENASVAIWSTRSGELITTLDGHTQPVTGVAFDPTGVWAVTSSQDGTIRTWSIDGTSEPSALG